MVAIGVGEMTHKDKLCELANAINGNLNEQVKIGETVIDSFYFGDPKTTDYQEILRLILAKQPSQEHMLKKKIAFLDEQIEGLKKERLEISGMQARVSANDVE
jgi:riboflavin synthase